MRYINGNIPSASHVRKSIFHGLGWLGVNNSIDASHMFFSSIKLVLHVWGAFEGNIFA